MTTEHQKLSMRERLTETKAAVDRHREAWLAYRGKDEVTEARLRAAYWAAEADLLRMLLSWAEHSTRPKKKARRRASRGTPDHAIGPLLLASIAAYRESRQRPQVALSAHLSPAIPSPLRRKRP